MPPHAAPQDGRPYLRCLGQPALFSPAGEPAVIRTRKHLGLLLYLAVEGRGPHRRERLAELFWPDAPAREARHSIATALSVLRARLGPGAIAATREHVALVEGSVALDLDRLLGGEVVAGASGEALEVAGFLEGFDIPGSAEFGQWRDRQRARLFPAVQAALVELIDRCRRTADTRRIEQLADTLLALDDLSEEAARAKMEARAFAGDRLAALRIFEEWRHRLADAVGAQPSGLIEGMAVRLRRRVWESAAPPDVAVRTEQWRDRAFVGRAGEYRQLYEAWEETRRGRASHVLVLGDSGIGKSTLVDRLTTAAGLEGAVSSRTQCYDLEQQIPYAALGNLVHGLLGCPGVSGTPPEALAEIALTVKEVRRRFPAVPAAEESQGETARFRLAEAFHLMLETIADEHPVILVVDDLHLCDEASLSVLHLVARRARSRPVMLVLVARAGELSRSPGAARLRSAAPSLGIRELELPPLSEAESAELLAALLGPAHPAVNAGSRRAITRAAAGFPMVLELLVQDWQAHGDHAVALAVGAMTESLEPGAGSPPVYRQAFERLVVALDPATRQVLDVAAVLGHRLNDLGLYAIADLGQGQVMAAMAHLLRQRVLRDGGRGLEFVNELVRAAAYLEVPSPVRRALHSGIAERLMEEERRGVRFLGLEIAWHAARAGRAAEMRSFLFKGAREAVAQGALDSAGRALTTALPQLAPDDRTAATLLLAEALQDQGRWTESLAVLGEDERARTSSAGTVLTILAELRTGAATGELLSRDVRRLLAIAESDPSAQVRLKAANAAGQLLGDVRDQAVARGLLAAVDAIGPEGLSEQEGDELALCRARFLYYSGRQAAVLDVLTELAESLRSRGMAGLTLIRVRAGLGAVRCHRGEYAAGKAEFLAAYDLVVKAGNEVQQVGQGANIALCCLRLGEYDEVMEWTGRPAGTGNPRYTSVQRAFYRAFALAMRGEAAEALRTLGAFESDLPEEPLWLVQARKLHRADVMWVCGQRAAALAEAREAIGNAPSAPHSYSFAGGFARWLALVSREDGTVAEARPALEALGRMSDDLDAVDRAEITCARLVADQEDDVRDELMPLLSRHLSRLPATVATQLQRLGVLSNGRGARETLPPRRGRSPARSRPTRAVRPE